MTLCQKVYTLLWISAMLISSLMVLRDRKSFGFLSKAYFLFLFKPWKIATFAPGLIFMTFIAPFSGDYTWDYLDGSVMSVLTYVTAPWALGTLWRWTQKQASLKLAFVAACLWMFSMSWFYDLYIFLRDGYYPPTWLANIILSSILYGCAGLLWNLDWNLQRGVFFSFTSPKDAWYCVSDQPVFAKIIKKGWMYIAIVLVLCLGVVYKLRNP